MKFFALVLLIAAAVDAKKRTSHDRKLDVNILEILEDEREAMRGGNTALAQQKFNEALGVMRQIKNADFEKAEKPAEKKENKKAAKAPSKAAPKAKEAKKTTKPVAPVETDQQKDEPKEEAKEETQQEETQQEETKEEPPKDDAAAPENADLEKDSATATPSLEKKDDEVDETEFITLKKAVKSSLEQVKGDAANKDKAEALLKEHHSLLESLKNMKSGKTKPTKDTMKEMKQLQTALNDMKAAPPADLEKDETAVEDFKKLKAQVRSQLDGLKANSEMRELAEKVLKKHHSLLTAIKDIKGKQTPASPQIIAELKQLQAEVTAATSSGSSSLEKKAPTPTHKKKSALSAQLERIKKAKEEMDGADF